MAIAVPYTDTCAVTRPASRRFYVHVGSLGFLVAAQPTFFGEVAHALGLSGASRALDQVAEDLTMFSPSSMEPALVKATGILHDQAADALRTAFQCIVQLVPPQFGSTELLLGPSEQISAWCYEDGYLTYATDENAAAIMYAETGSLRRLRAEIRRAPDYDPALQMISGQSLFLFDQRFGAGRETARLYKQHSARLLRDFHGISPLSAVHSALVREIEGCVSSSARTFEGDSVIDTCVSRGELMVTTLLRNLPPEHPSTAASASTATTVGSPALWCDFMTLLLMKRPHGRGPGVGARNWIRNHRLTDPIRGSYRLTACSGGSSGAAYSNCRMEGVVTADGVAPVAVEHYCTTPTKKWPYPGQELPVLVDRADPQRLRIIWDDVPTGREVGRQQAQAAAERMAAGASGAAGANGTTFVTGDLPPQFQSIMDAFQQASGGFTATRTVVTGAPGRAAPGTAGGGTTPEQAAAALAQPSGMQRATAVVLTSHEVSIPAGLTGGGPAGVVDITLDITPADGNPYTAVTRVSFSTPERRARFTAAGARLNVLVDPADHSRVIIDPSGA
jgi:hypothetical protein